MLFEHLFEGFSWQDILDIVLVSFLIYQILLIVRGTRVFTIFIGLVIIGFLYSLSYTLGLYSLNWLLQYIVSSLFIFIVVIFQNDIRQWLGDIGAKSVFNRKALQSNSVEEVTQACVEMARLRIGALIVIERKMHLGDMIRREGVRVDAMISRQLLMNIFYPKAPLHDGAIIISGGRISAAGCILPLAEAKGQNFGTRHRAALGITQESDAIAIAVSEERGEISMAIKGELARPLDAARLKQALNDII